MKKSEMVKFAMETWPTERDIENCGNGKTKDRLARMNCCEDCLADFLTDGEITLDPRKVR